MLVDVLDTPPSGCPHSPPPYTTMFPCIALVMPLSRDTLTKLSMTLVHLGGAKSLQDPLVSQLLGEWVASSRLARARCFQATEVGYPSLIHNKENEAVKQYASLLFPAPDHIGLPLNLDVPKLGFRHMSEYMSRRGWAYTAATGLPFPKPVPTQDTFTDTWKELVTCFHLWPPESIPDTPASGRSWPLLSWTRCAVSAVGAVCRLDGVRQRIHGSAQPAPHWVAVPDGVMGLWDPVHPGVAATLGQHLLFLLVLLLLLSPIREVVACLHGWVRGRRATLHGSWQGWRSRWSLCWSCHCQSCLHLGHLWRQTREKTELIFFNF